MSRRAVIGVAAGAVTVAVAMLATLGYGDRSDHGAAAPATAPPKTAPVTRTTLVDAVHLTGKVGYGTAEPLDRMGRREEPGRQPGGDRGRFRVHGRCTKFLALQKRAPGPVDESCEGQQRRSDRPGDPPLHPHCQTGTVPPLGGTSDHMLTTAS
ncbi:hypothetical protein GCM10022255_110400 [Dactylosporangium darangshiense]|uniref:Uncharacterized protein n=1 Tax=Dactylosporangium darangshiense TaxID=579108 RepID=A0ABP8DUI2_9ACTN